MTFEYTVPVVRALQQADASIGIARRIFARFHGPGTWYVQGLTASYIFCAPSLCRSNSGRSWSAKAFKSWFGLWLAAR